MFLIFGGVMAKVTIIGATGRVGQFAAYSVSRIPFVTKIVIFGRKGNEDAGKVRPNGGSGDPCAADGGRGGST